MNELPLKLQITTDWSDKIWIGEHNAKSGKLNGPGIRITNEAIYIGYFKDGCSAPGYEISIWMDGRLFFGEFYLDEAGIRKWTGIEYFSDGRTRKY